MGEKPNGKKKKKKKKRERRCVEVQQEGNGKEGDKRMKEKERKKMRKKRENKKIERKEGRKEMRRGIRTNLVQGAESDGKGPKTTLREVGFLLLRFF